MPDRPPIRMMTRALAELQSVILAGGLHLTQGNLDRFAILALIVRQTMLGPTAGRPVSVLSLADSLSRPYETVRRHVAALHADRLCARAPRFVGPPAERAERAALDDVLDCTHDAVVSFIADLHKLGVLLPRARRSVPYDRSAAVIAGVDIMLSILDSNRRAHGEWNQLVFFSVILAINVHGFAREPQIARQYADETAKVPPELLTPATIAQVRRVLASPETTIRRHVAVMCSDGRLLPADGGWVVSQDWLNAPPHVNVSRASFSNIQRILARLAASGFPFHLPASAYVRGRPIDTIERAAPKSCYASTESDRR